MGVQTQGNHLLIHFHYSSFLSQMPPYILIHFQRLFENPWPWVMERNGTFRERCQEGDREPVEANLIISLL